MEYKFKAWVKPVIEQAREALKYCKVSVCRPAEGVADVTIAEINNALNSTKQSVNSKEGE